MTRRTVTADTQSQKKSGEHNHQQKNESLLWSGKKWWFCWKSSAFSMGVDAERVCSNALRILQSAWFVDKMCAIFYGTHQFFVCHCIREFFGAEKVIANVLFFLCNLAYFLLPPPHLIVHIFHFRLEAFIHRRINSLEHILRCLHLPDCKLIIHAKL